MVLRLIEKHGKLTIEEMALLSGIPKQLIEIEVKRLWEDGEICMDEDGRCYIPPKIDFSAILAVAFLIFVMSVIFLGALKETIGG